MKVNRSDRPLLISVLMTPLFALAAVIFQSVTLLSDYDATTGYYAHGTSLYHATAVILLLTAAALLAAVLFARKHLSPAPDANGLSVLFSGGFLALSLAACTVILILTLAKSEETSTRFFLFMIMLAAAASVAYMALTLYGAKSRLRMALSVAPILYAVLSAMYLYFIPGVQINAPVKLLEMLALLSIALFALSECRNLIGRAKPALHLFITAFSAVVTAAASIPSLIFSAARATTPVLAMSTVGDFVTFAFFLYIMARLFSLLPVKAAPLLHHMIGVLLAREEEESTAEQEEPAPEPITPAELSDGLIDMLTPGEETEETNA